MVTNLKFESTAERKEFWNDVNNILRVDGPKAADEFIAQRVKMQEIEDKAQA